MSFQFELPIAPPAPPVLAAVPPPPYVVALRDCDDLTMRERIEAEKRYSAALEQRLGPPPDVAALLHMLMAIEEEQRTLTPDEQAAARKWQRAHLAARFVGLQGLAEITSAHFEVQLS